MSEVSGIDAGERIARILACPPADLTEAESYVLAVLGQVWEGLSILPEMAARLAAIESKVDNAERVITETAGAVTSGGGLLGKLLGGGKGPGTAPGPDLAALAGLTAAG